jgi:hypothetical protein
MLGNAIRGRYLWIGRGSLSAVTAAKEGQVMKKQTSLLTVAL